MIRLAKINFFLCLLFIFIIYLYTKSSFYIINYSINTDLVLAYIAGLTLNIQTTAYSFSDAYLSMHHLKNDAIYYLSPPFFIMLMTMIAKWLHYTCFLIGFFIFSMSLNIIALLKLYRHFYSAQASTHTHAMLFIAANLIYTPSLMNITFCQLALILNAIIIFTFLALQQKQAIRAGLYFGLAINIKLFFAIFLVYFIANKNWRSLLSMIFFTILFASLPLVFFGKPIYQGYWKILHHIQWYGINWNASWLGFMTRFFGESSHRFKSLFFFPALSRYAYDGVLIIYGILIFYVSRKHPGHPLTFAFTLSSMLLLSPLGWSYYFPLLITSFFISLDFVKQHSHHTRHLCLLLLALFISSFSFPLDVHAETSTIQLLLMGNIFFLALFILNVVNFFQIINIDKHHHQAFVSSSLIIGIMSLCLLPSFIGDCSMAIFTKEKLLAEHEPPLLTENDYATSFTSSVAH